MSKAQSWFHRISSCPLFPNFCLRQSYSRIVEGRKFTPPLPRRHESIQMIDQSAIPLFIDPTLRIAKRKMRKIFHRAVPKCQLNPAAPCIAQQRRKTTPKRRSKLLPTLAPANLANLPAVIINRLAVLRIVPVNHKTMPVYLNRPARIKRPFDLRLPSSFLIKEINCCHMKITYLRSDTFP